MMDLNGTAFVYFRIIVANIRISVYPSVYISLYLFITISLIALIWNTFFSQKDSSSDEYEFGTNSNKWISKSNPHECK